MTRRDSILGGPVGRPRTRSFNLSDPTSSFHAAVAAEPRRAELGAFNTSDLCPGNRARYSGADALCNENRSWSTFSPKENPGDPARRDAQVAACSPGDFDRSR